MTELKIDDKALSDVAFFYFVLGQALDAERDSIPYENQRFFLKRFLAEYLLERSNGANLIGLDNYMENVRDDLIELLGSPSSI